MSTPIGYTRTDLRRDRAAEVLDVDSWGFAFTAPKDEREALYDIFDFERGRGIEIADDAHGDVGALAAVHSSLPYEMRVPGGESVATSGLTWVAVHPGHRRRGLLTDMMDDHFTRSLARGEAVSTLYAAEAEIYQRFGYGNACPSYAIDLGRKPAVRELAHAKNLRITLASADYDTHIDAVRAVQRRLARPGTMVEFNDVVAKDLFIDLESDRNRAEQLRIAIVEDEDGPAAFALFQRTGGEGEEWASGTTTVNTWGAATAAASQRLFAVLTDLDLMAKTKVSRVAADDPLLTSLVNLRATKPRLQENLWVRILDVTAALQARTYAMNCDLVLDVSDQCIDENNKLWRVAIEGGRATVTRVERGAPANLRIGIQELSAAYLGGVTITSLAAAGLVDEVTHNAAATLSTAMRGDALPVSNISF